MHDLLEGLNEQQARAVTSTAPCILTLAGAGSGKTTVLTRRVANLHLNQGVPMDSMLCLTFTRLAGMEMKERVMNLVGIEEGQKLFCGTFHAFAVVVLKEYGHLIDIEENFTIYGQDEREEIMRAIISDFGGRTSLKKVAGCFAAGVDYREEQRRRPEECRVLMEYDHRCKASNAADVDRLIGLVTRLWDLHPGVLEKYQRKFTYVFVDEYQDTNDEQAQMVGMLQSQNLFAVGDDFQAIYGWRGAKVHYILDFERRRESEVIKLEDNYRSTVQIVAAANRLIKHNVHQTDKTLIAHKSGSDVKLSCYDYEVVEIAKMIAALHDSGKAYKDIAVLARANKLADDVKNVLRDKDIAHVRVSGQEDPCKAPGVREIISFMNFIENKEDNVAFKKCFKALGLGRELYELDLDALKMECSLYNALCKKTSGMNTHVFMALINELTLNMGALPNRMPLAVFELLRTRLSIPVSGAIQMALCLIRAWQERRYKAGEACDLNAFLKYLKFRDVQEKLIDERDAVKIMTIHASKGLEFDTVILAGMNQGVFPSRRGDMEEERRLAYVAVTRAKNDLYVTYAREAADWAGNTAPAEPSQFIKEMGLA